MENTVRKSIKPARDNASTGKKKLMVPFRIKVTPEKKNPILNIKSTGKSEKKLMPIPIKILEKLFPDEERSRKSFYPMKTTEVHSVRRKLINDTPKVNKKFDMKPLTSLKTVPKEKCTRRTTINQKSFITNNAYQQSIKSLASKSTPIASKSCLPKSSADIKYESSKKIPKNNPNEAVYSENKLVSLKTYIQESIKSMNAALNIVDDLLESSKSKPDKMSVVSKSIQTSFAESKEEFKNINDSLKAKEENKENINSMKKRKFSSTKHMITPKRRSLRLANKIERSLSESNLNIKDMTTNNSNTKFGSDYEDSFLKMEHELNIVHDKKTNMRKTIGASSLREFALLQAGNSVVNTPQNGKLLRSKSILNTPRTVTSKSAMKQLQSLLSESPFHH